MPGVDSKLASYLLYWSGAVVEHRFDNQKVMGSIPNRVTTSFLHIVRNITDTVETNGETQTKEPKTQKGYHQLTKHKTSWKLDSYLFKILNPGFGLMS